MPAPAPPPEAAAAAAAAGAACAAAADLGCWQVPNELAALEATRLAVLERLAPHALSPRLVFQLELVLEETLMNRLWHAFPAGGIRHTTLRLRLDTETLELQFEDDGVAFDPTAAALPAAPASLAEARPGGLGLLLTRKAARSCHYVRRDGRNHFSVVLNRG